MADVKFPNISNSNNTSFVDGRPTGKGFTNAGLSEYDENGMNRN